SRRYTRRRAAPRRAAGQERARVGASCRPVYHIAAHTLSRPCEHARGSPEPRVAPGRACTTICSRFAEAPPPGLAWGGKQGWLLGTLRGTLGAAAPWDSPPPRLLSVAEGG